MSDTLKISGPIKVGSFASDPAGAENGFIYYNTTDSKFKMFQSGAFKEIVDEDVIAALTGTDVSYARADVNKKNVDVASDDVESAITDLDDAIGALEASPSNYTPTDAGIVADHLSAIDSALATAGGSEFEDTSFKVFDNADGTKKIRFELSALTTGFERTIVAADETVNLADIGINSAKVSADGSVTTHNDVTDAGSGQIITSSERSKLSGIEAGATADQTDAEIKTAYENNADTNAFTDAEQSKLAGIESGATADQTGAEIKAAYEAELDTNAFTDAEKTKLAGIEAGADVTDATNVDAAGATMNTDTDVSGNSWVVDEDDMLSNDNTKVPTQQSVKAYVDNTVSSATSYKGGYDAATDTPSLDSAPNVGISTGDQYTVTVAGTFYTIDVEVGDVLIAEIDDPTAESDWTIVNKNLDAASIKAQYESNSDTNAFTDAEQSKLSGIESGATADQTGSEIKALYEAEADTNAFTDAEKTKLANQSGTNTGDEVAASTTVSGIVELATTAETDAGTDTDRAVTPASLTNVLSNIAGKMDDLVDDLTPQLGGNLDTNGNDIEDASNDILVAGQNSFKRAKQASKSNFVEEEYIHSISLTGSQTNTVISDFTFAHATIEGLEITYKVKESTSNDIRIGTMRVVTNGTSVVLNDMATETADTGVTFSAAINGANVEIRYSSGSNGATLRADVKKFLA